VGRRQRVTGDQDASNGIAGAPHTSKAIAGNGGAGPSADGRSSRASTGRQKWLWPFLHYCSKLIDELCGLRITGIRPHPL
jgi:hypothetical protein